MSVNISISNKNNNCSLVLNKFIQLGINCRLIETTSVVDQQLEKGCLLTLAPKYNNKKEVTKIWNIVNSNNDFECAHLKIDGIFDGCIYNYIRSNFCPGD